MDRTGNTAFSSSSVVIGSYLTMPRVLLMCLPAVTKQQPCPSVRFEVPAQQRVYNTIWSATVYTLGCRIVSL